MSDELLEKPFEPCVIVYDDPKTTEMVLRDAPVVWVIKGDCDLGYDMETGDLTIIRLHGDVSKRHKS